MSGNCFECGAEARHQHHVVPQSRGGRRTLPLCSDCHGLVHDVDFSKAKNLYPKDLKPYHAEIAGRYAGGETFTSIAAAYGVRTRRISNIISRLGLRRPSLVACTATEVAKSRMYKSIFLQEETILQG